MKTTWSSITKIRSSIPSLISELELKRFSSTWRGNSQWRCGNECVQTYMIQRINWFYTHIKDSFWNIRPPNTIFNIRTKYTKSLTLKVTKVTMKTVVKTSKHNSLHNKTLDMFTKRFIKKGKATPKQSRVQLFFYFYFRSRLILIVPHLCDSSDQRPSPTTQQPPHSDNRWEMIECAGPAFPGLIWNVLEECSEIIMRNEHHNTLKSSKSWFWTENKVEENI